MGRIRDLVSKVKDGAAPVASVVKEEVSQRVERVKERLKGGEEADEWSFKGVAAQNKTASGRSEPSTAQTAPPPAEPAAGASSSTSSPAPQVGRDGGGDETDDKDKKGETGTPPEKTETSPPAKQIKIMAQPSATDPTVCKFMVEVPVYEDTLIRVTNRELAEHSPLAKRLFEIPQIASLTFTGGIVTVTKAGPDPWQLVARAVGPAIRAHLASGEPAITADPEVFDFPVAEAGSEELQKRVQDVIDGLINPGIASHGGYVTLLSVEGDIAYIQMGGGCQGCGMADVTLKQGIATTIQSQVPEIKQVLDSTDHGSGSNPFYSPGK